jgi:ABC-2 type transport system permease protein
MRAYLAFFRMRFRTLIQYRSAALAGVVTQLLFGFVRVMVLNAFYAYAEGPMPMTLPQAVSYTWIGQALLGIFPWNVEPEVGQTVRTGQIAYELNRPLDLYWMWYVRCLAERLAPILLRAAPIFIVASLLPAPYTLIWPTGARMGAWLAATAGALFLAAAMTSLLNVSLLFTVSGEGIVRLLPTLTLLLSGMTVPLALLPEGLQWFLKMQPYAGVFDLPSRFFTGMAQPREVFGTLILQLVWTALVIALCRTLMRRALRRVTIAGG